MSRLPLDRRVTMPVVGCAGADVFYTCHGGSGSGGSAAVFPQCIAVLASRHLLDYETKVVARHLRGEGGGSNLVKRQTAYSMY